MNGKGSLEHLDGRLTLMAKSITHCAQTTEEYAGLSRNGMIWVMAKLRQELMSPLVQPVTRYQ